MTERDASDAGTDSREILMTGPLLTPYDTGARLEPQPWPPDGNPDCYGRGDFDDDESATVLTVYAERLPDSTHALRLELLAGEGNTLITVDGVLYAPVTAPHANNTQENR